MAAVSTGHSTFKIPDGIPYARVPADFPARCKAVGLCMHEENVLIALMSYQFAAPDGALYLKGGTSSQIAKSCGMSPANVRKAIVGLRKKGVIEQTNNPRIHRLVLDLWRHGASIEKHFTASGEAPGDSHGKHPPLTEGSSCASTEKRPRFPREAPYKKNEEAKNVNRRRTVVREMYE